MLRLPCVHVVALALLIESLNLHTKVDLHARQSDGQTAKRRQTRSRLRILVVIAYIGARRRCPVTMKKSQVAAVNSRL